MTPADEAARSEGQSLNGPLEPDQARELALQGGPASRPEDKGTSLTPAFARMRTDWNSPDRDVVTQMRQAVNLLVQHQFGDVFDIFFQVYALVREQEIDTTTGEVRTDELGVPVWRRNPATGSYIEDWSRLGIKEREQFLYQLTTGLFRWEQLAADVWGEAMFARASFEEAFSHGFEELAGDKPTIDDRTARARIRAAEYRYRAVYQSYLSKRADAVVRSAERLAQRLKDMMVSGN
jgi:hypothetical protein